MQVKKTISVSVEKQTYVVSFGTPQTEEELNKMYRLRYYVYSKRGYINKEEYPEKVEKDEYDNGNAIYVVAQINDRILGTVRLIVDKFLPTEKDCFDFMEPEKLKPIKRTERAELGRLIVERLADDKFFPRHVVTQLRQLFVLQTLLVFCLSFSPLWYLKLR